MGFKNIIIDYVDGNCCATSSCGCDNASISALKFLYETVFDKEWNSKNIPRLKHRRRLPAVLSREEVQTIFLTPFGKIKLSKSTQLCGLPGHLHFDEYSFLLFSIYSDGRHLVKRTNVLVKCRMLV